jgi:hypothetical protein
MNSCYFSLLESANLYEVGFSVKTEPNMSVFGFVNNRSVAVA